MSCSCPWGFRLGQGGLADVDGEFIWCCADDEFFGRWPHVLPSGEQTLGSTACVDVTMRLDLDQHGQWRIGMIGLDGHDLAPVLLALGDDAAAATADALLGSPLEGNVEPLRDVLAACLGPRMTPEPAP